MSPCIRELSNVTFHTLPQEVDCTSLPLKSALVLQHTLVNGTSRMKVCRFSTQASRDLVRSPHSLGRHHFHVNSSDSLLDDKSTRPSHPLLADQQPTIKDTNEITWPSQYLTTIVAEHRCVSAGPAKSNRTTRMSQVSIVHSQNHEPNQ